jgi:hypothetical protein
MAIVNLYEEESSSLEHQDENLVEEALSLEEEIQACTKKPSFWKTLGLRVAFLFAVFFCVAWFFWTCMAYVGWCVMSIVSPANRFIAQKNRIRYAKGLHLTSISFLGCSLAIMSPYLGLSFLLAYFGVFSSEFRKEGIYLNELIDRIKRFSA